MPFVEGLPQIIVLNGTSSSGKTSIARALQTLLPTQYLNFSIDSVLDTLPPEDLARLQRGDVISRNGYDWQNLVRGYHYCLPGLLQAGLRLIVDNAWCHADETRELLTELAGYRVVLVGVQCALAEVVRREAERGDRPAGLAAWEFERVHGQMQYDLVVDTGIQNAQACAAELAALLQTPAGSFWRGAADTLERLSLGL
ncbi:chloramphenicol 3-O phosphotransferase [Silvimonas terrae]|uniref:Chloramphenicol 3-O phosphotransferase n=1 Tax=Silvimonas terrae TaxID=300266 RepID=A0A840RF54_9NEIS|nr:AAA family ATPase [Silvimonas terrae]MBB5191965.1 chloramphenicol 3-O phosphotransferase [Silvimonas terrae]